ncbi:MAG: DAK2 domain-containing protein [Clostridia bacterium]|nr:DAK2 domain-containing protein [Clostridia bacterium]
MLKKIDGKIYIDLLNHGIRNIEKHRSILNDLNVFPVPDGDTGTNMLMTLRQGYEAVAKNIPILLPDAAQRFSSSAVFGARGNSGVIVSQFFKGISEAFDNEAEADPFLFAAALNNGCKRAYAAVADPVEGTMLTVIKDASAAVTRALPLQSIEELVNIFLGAARISLENTPELLPVLKKANVVDSGGSGIVYFFEGVEKYLRGEEIEIEEKRESDRDSLAMTVDLSRFNKDTAFDYGYCVEGLIQLGCAVEAFSHAKFKKGLSELGNSIVSSLEGDKVKIHIHSKCPGNIINYCQTFGEFLTVKIENMTVQNAVQEQQEREQNKFLYSDEPSGASFAVIAVAGSPTMQRKFFELGADVAITSEIAPSSQDFMDAFQYTHAKKILVFPNSSNSIMTAMQASKLYEDAAVTVLNSYSIAECYAALSVMDFDADIEDAAAQANAVISNIRQVVFYRAPHEIKYGGKTIAKNDYFSLQGKKILVVGKKLEAVVLRTVEYMQKKQETAVITVFYGRRIPAEYAEDLAELIGGVDRDVEVATVSTMDRSYELAIIFE